MTATFLPRRQLELPGQFLLERAVIAEAGQGIEQGVLAGLAVEVLEPVAVLGEAVDVAKHRGGHAGHDDGHDDRAGGEEDECEAASGAAAGPKPLHRRNTHERDELDRHDPDHPAADGGGGLVGGGFRWVGFGLVGHGNADDGRCHKGCTSPASLL